LRKFRAPRIFARCHGVRVIPYSYRSIWVRLEIRGINPWMTPGTPKLSNGGSDTSIASVRCDPTP
jgi:hypothetical protein